MGKKRTKGKSVPVKASSESAEPMCRHLRKGLEQGNLKKALANVEWNICQDCKTDNKVKEGPEEEAEDPSVWLCLKCGHQGCGRDSQEQHALKHYSTPRSEPHYLVLSLDNWSVWCYKCDEEVKYCSSNRLGQVVDYVRKQAGTTTPKPAEKDNGHIELENKKLEKDSKNEQEKEKTENMAKENIPMDSASQMIVKGLSNLGNTCFFNAVMQNLSQTPVLRELLKEVKMSGTIVKIEPPDLALTEPLEVNLEPPGPLTLAMSQFLNEMQENKKRIVTPKELFSQVCKKATRFKGYQQQDSQELLRYLLDGMRAEEHQRVSKGILKAFGNSTEKLDEEVKNKVKEYEKKKTIPSFVDRIFGGELTSTIMCEECRTVSLVHESFLDLSLPVLDDQSGKKNINDRNMKKTMEEDDKDSEEEKDDSYMKTRSDVPSGTSKHIQKKAKKQAKKQAKNQRRQQKLQEKVLHLNDICSTDHTEDNEQESEMALPGEVEVDIESNHVSQEEGIHTGAEVNQKDLNGQEKMVESTADSQKCPEALALKSEGDVGSLTSATECTRDLNDAILEESTNGELDITNGLKNLHLNAAIHPDEINIEIVNDSHSPPAKVYEVMNEDPETAFCTLANREAFSTAECSIQHCLYQFTRNEKLQDANKLLCDVCTRRQGNGPKANIKGEKKHVYTNAKKQMLVSLAPPVLTLHLKRFQQAGFNLRKVNKHIKFPEILDLAPFCTLKCKNVAEESTRVLYSLYGVVEHSGTMRSGHYTAYAKARTPSSHLSNFVLHGDIPQDCEMESTKGQWFHISDTHVQAVPVTKVLNSQAYLLFYERIL
ncbi:ubiquitin carboxyl-terminal hydrolase 16 isoform X1 [Cricetulus griseus]|uniref:Ubiquitin carboxyl-terminal hydrolase 16 n=1 Tax=Cricetulus griseus TaxID=10029 RepID=G3GT04_CRIGR|nr:ubiquitin carboxyl-terminal hydrolase 16 isoform X1 [Cricetulus griseus]XP_007639973.1 ubiquitin carboxyl-terminal hydrolase 16 isoform X1 [Cricetulus griseus]XP_007639982.1 ubiquitin carboxyl-terminal hydrolase 16 isoform X1 [Cricetulus griseus]XP_027291561.1 ubiquitin carboxyl-terminal hydrolase 16 isoform X1 [Cricetulus griseus]XP_035311249.1 ubiquitin carboxyl-terminal hydrolase 16 isoform X1 [Cricetulus griseus]EGW01433.1 Ubiquitin carboxyl-terminal hydrolase 16 [Cricetulus griseus]